MTSPILSSEQIGHLTGVVAEYISAQRLKALLAAVPLDSVQSASMTGFFPQEVFDSTRLLVLDGTRVENPPFYAFLLQIGFITLPDFTTMAAITFGDVVVSHQPFTDGLLFHELVHVVQYRQLGIARFAELYVRGFLAGGGYDGIPLEVNARQLEDRASPSGHSDHIVS